MRFYSKPALIALAGQDYNKFKLPTSPHYGTATGLQSQNPAQLLLNLLVLLFLRTIFNSVYRGVMLQLKDDWHGGTPGPPIWPQHPLRENVKKSLGSLGVSQGQESSHYGDFKLVLGHSENIRVSFSWNESYLISFKGRSYYERSGIYQPRGELWDRDYHLWSPGARIQSLRCSWNHLSIFGHGNHPKQSCGPLNRVSKNLPSVISTHGASQN